MSRHAPAEPLPPPPHPILIKCSHDHHEGCNRWVWSHSRTPMAFFYDDQAFCADHTPGVDRGE